MKILSILMFLMAFSMSCLMFGVAPKFVDKLLVKLSNKGEWVIFAIGGAYGTTIAVLAGLGVKFWG